MDERDERIRLAAFAFLERQVRHLGDALPRAVLADGFVFEGQRVPLLGPQGIFKPAVLSDVPLSITTVPVVQDRPRPYEDEIRPDGTASYAYRGIDPDHRDNVGLRTALQRGTPLIYFHGLVPGRYYAHWPVFVVGDDRQALRFTIALDDAATVGPGRGLVAGEGRRAYVARLTRTRLHQAMFRVRVLQAYRSSCAMCRLRHDELLDAAHILPDADPRSEPIVPNGLALCKLHHAAFDRHILGVRPDLVIEVRTDILAEIDGPMLRHGLQGFHGTRLTVPRQRASQPDKVFLEDRYERFRVAS